MNSRIELAVPCVAGAETVPEVQLEQLAYQYGRTYDSYLATERGLNRFWSSDGQGVIVYAQLGRYAHVQGGLLCDPFHREQLLREFYEFAKARKLTITFYNVVEEDLPLFRHLGFQATKWGEEPFLDLENLTWSGGSYEWVRRQYNHCRKLNIELTECRRADYSESEWERVLDEIRDIAAEGRRSKPQRDEIWFFNGKVDPPDWGRRRLFLAKSQEGAGRTEGFLVCLPFQNGSSWSIETYRHRQEAPKGVVPFMVHQCAEKLRFEGIQSVSLCLCPAVRCEALPNDSWLVRRGLQFGFHYASIFFDLPGEYHFKSRFRPRFVKRYICHWPQASVRSMWSLVRLSGVMTLDYRKLAGALWNRLRHPRTRNLAAPPASGEKRGKATEK